MAGDRALRRVSGAEEMRRKKAVLMALLEEKIVTEIHPELFTDHMAWPESISSWE